ncbi:hypothetical protein phytr_3130 [Candidatus Phycorickettsia trachydisci]|uniref:Uncharacterized protein n=1 Tax=Candidatus Phycorickettsia trachydisci TaxID=2115978 RepID=A0A2P1P7L8_9RICK|nr:hypothetical protein [Candidatus Phycorickettsia trachydisci]AVP87267.1 hypothetical protein phytr_3130 [Candidatus Phycorickettsia trachydisci]
MAGILLRRGLVGMGELFLSNAKGQIMKSEFVQNYAMEGIEFLLNSIDLYPSKSLEDIKRFKYAKIYWKEDVISAAQEAKKIFKEAWDSGKPSEVLLACGKCLKITTSGIAKFCNRYPYLTATTLAVVRLAVAATLFTFAPFTPFIAAGMTFDSAAITGMIIGSAQLIQRAILNPKAKEKERLSAISNATGKTREILTAADEERFTEMLKTKHEILKNLGSLHTTMPELNRAFSLAEDLANIQLNLEKNLKNLPETERTKRQKLNTNPLSLIMLGLEEKQIKQLATKEDINPVEFSKFVDLAARFQNAHGDTDRPLDYDMVDSLTKIQLNLEKNLSTLPEAQKIGENLALDPLELTILGVEEDRIKQLATKENINPIEFSEFISSAYKFQQAYNNHAPLSKYELLNTIQFSANETQEELKEKVRVTLKNYEENFHSHHNHPLTNQLSFCTQMSKDFTDLCREIRQSRISNKTKQDEIDPILLSSAKLESEFYNSDLISTMHKLADNPITKYLGLNEIGQSKQKNPLGVITPDQSKEIEAKRQKEEKHKNKWKQHIRKKQEREMRLAKNQGPKR